MNGSQAGEQAQAEAVAHEGRERDAGETLQHPARLADFLNYRLYHLTRVALQASGHHLRAAAG